MKRPDDLNLYEVELPATLPMPRMRAFAAYQKGGLVGFTLVDEQTNTMQLEHVVPSMREQGIADALEGFAREKTGLTLDQVTGDLTPWGMERVKKHGFKIAPGQTVRQIDERDIAPAVAQLAAMFAKEPKV